MHSFRSAVDFARSSSRECLRRCQRRGLFLSVGGGETGGSSGDIGDGERSAQEILEYRLFREFCEPAATQDGEKHGNSVGGRNGVLGGYAVRLRQNRSVSCSESLQRAHHRQTETVTNGSASTAAAADNVAIASSPSCNGPAPSVKMRSQRTASSVSRLSRKLRQCEVVLLDGSEATFSIDPSSKAQALLDLVCQFLSITERQYFGLCYKDPALGVFQWLNNDKRIGKQLDATWPTWRLDFAVKFYPARPESLSDASARSCVALQVRQCLVTGRLPCSIVGYALLGSYLMQSELGDRRIGLDVDEADVDEPAFCPPEVLTAQPGVARLARRLHACHAGLASRDAERDLLANARRLAAYGLDVHAARCVKGDRNRDDRKEVDGESEVLVGVCADGLVLMRPEGLLRLARLTWPRVTALTRRGREVRVALRRQPLAATPLTVATASATATTTMRLRCDNGRMAKRLWRSAVEHHAFFRLKSRDSSTRERIQSGTVRLSRSCSNGVGFAGRASSTYLTTPSNAALQRSTSLPYQRRAASVNPVGDIGGRPATLVTPEDVDDSACRSGVAPSNRECYAEVAHDASKILAREAAESQSVWCDEQFDQASIEPSTLDRSAATECSAVNGSRRFIINSNSSTSRLDSSSTDYYQEHEQQPTTASDVVSGSPVSRHPPSGEETPCSGQQDKRCEAMEDCRRNFLQSPDLQAPTPADYKLPFVRADTIAVGVQNRTSAAPVSSATAAAEVEGELSRMSVVETRTETMEINEPVEELVSFTDEHGNNVTRKLFRCRTIRRIVTDTVVESPLSAWYLYCQENKVDEATMAAVMEQLRLKRAQDAGRNRDEGFV